MKEKENSYQVIHQEILNDIERGVYRPGDSIPKQTELAEKYGVSRGTIRKAVADLISRKILITTKRKGTVVADNATKQEDRFRPLSFSKSKRVTPGNLLSKVIDIREFEAEPWCARVLQIPVGAPIVHIRRVRIMNGTATNYQCSYLSKELFGNTNPAKLDLEHSSLFEAITELSGKYAVMKNEEIKAIACPAYVAEELNMQPWDPLLLITRTVYSQDDKPMEYCEDYECTDRKGLFITTDIRKLQESDKKAIVSHSLEKLVISDVDGTLLDRKDTFDESHERLKQMIKGQKIPFTLASGRCYANMEKLIDYLNIQLPVIVNNGTAIMTKERVFWKKEMQTNDLRAAIEYADFLGMFVSVCDEYGEFIYRHNAYVQTYVDRFQKKYHYLLRGDNQFSDEQWRRMKIQKLLIIDPQKPGRIDKVIEKLRKEELSIVKYDDRSIDVMPKGCSKEKAVLQLCAMLDIDAAKVMTVGDNENDIEMTMAVGFGAAVGNATESLKNVSEHISIKTGAEGVCDLMSRYLEGGDNAHDET